MPDRLGSNLNAGVGWLNPYGDPSAAGLDKVEFATYTRDSYTGFDYAQNRMYSSYDGRFNTPDPAGRRAARRKDPGSWNRYAYTRGDPVNRRDKSGLGDDGGDDGCVEFDDGTYDCGTVITDDSWGDQLDDLFDDPEYAEDCLAEFQECQQLVAAQQAVVAFQAQVNWSTQFRVQAAGYIALNALLSPSCASLFGVGAIGVPDPYDMLSAILNGTGYAAIAYANMAPIQGDPANPPYAINNATTNSVGPPSNGFTYNSATITFNTSPLAPFNFAGTSLVNNAATILHELGHVYMYLYGQSTTSILNDSTSSVISAANQKLVTTQCFPGQ
jgi:RHS repeat-associated protein